jgi:hypothetical protein
MGQNFTLVFSFTNSEFVRLFTITTQYEVELKLQTNSSGTPGLLQGTGYLTDQSGNALEAPETLGSASSNSGFMVAGLFPQVGRPIDHYDVHFELVFPSNSGLEVTDSTFRLLGGSDSPFGIGPGLPTDIVPDIGSTFTLFSLSVAVMLAFGYYSKSRSALVKLKTKPLYSRN